MEIGAYGWKRDIDFIHHGLRLGGPQFINIPAPASTSYGLLNLGDAPFDGQSPGYFADSPFSTVIAINLKSASLTRFFACAVAGIQTFVMNADGTVFLPKNPDAITGEGCINIGGSFYSGAGQFAGDANGTYLAISSPSSFVGTAIDVQSNGTSCFSVSHLGFTYVGNNLQVNQTFMSSTLANLIVAQGVSFTGSSNGTGIGVNMASGFTGNIVDCQLNGAARFKVDNAGAVTAASTVTAGTRAAPFPLTNSITLKASDSTMTSNTAFVDGPAVSCVAGTWLLIACCTVVCGTTAGTLTGKLWDGTTVICSSETRQTASQASSITLCGVVSPGSTTTYKMSVATTTGATNASTLKAAAVNNGAGNNATWITAVRIG